MKNSLISDNSNYESQKADKTKVESLLKRLFLLGVVITTIGYVLQWNANHWARSVFTLGFGTMINYFYFNAIFKKTAVAWASGLAAIMVLVAILFNSAHFPAADKMVLPAIVAAIIYIIIMLKGALSPKSENSDK